MKSKWKPVPELKDTGWSPLPNCVKKSFGLNGRKFPRIEITVRRGNEGVFVAANRKRANVNWWEACDIPFELIGEVIQMLEAERDRK